MSNTGKYWDVSCNPIIRCSHASPGYLCAPVILHVLFDESQLAKLNRRKPSVIFVPNMADLFHPLVVNDWILSTFRAMLRNPQHTYLLLTKRAVRMAKNLTSEYFQAEIPQLMNPPVNWYLGITAENQECFDKRIPYLRELSDAGWKTWASLEPLVDRISLRVECGTGIGELVVDDAENRSWLNWIVVGAETGPGARPCHPDWVRHLRDECISREARIPFWLKSLGPGMGRELDGREWNQVPWEKTNETV